MKRSDFNKKCYCLNVLFEYLEGSHSKITINVVLLRKKHWKHFNIVQYEEDC